MAAYWQWRQYTSCIGIFELHSADSNVLVVVNEYDAVGVLVVMGASLVDALRQRRRSAAEHAEHVHLRTNVKPRWRKFFICHAKQNFVWLVRSPGTVSHCTLIRSAPTLSTFKVMVKTHLFLDPTSVTNCFPEYEQRTLYGALVLTVAMLLRLTYCRFIIIIIIINIIIFIFTIINETCTGKHEEASSIKRHC